MIFGFRSPADTMKQTIIKDNGPGCFYISFDARTLQEYHFGVVIRIRTHLKFTFLKKRTETDYRYQFDEKNLQKYGAENGGALMQLNIIKSRAVACLD